MTIPMPTMLSRLRRVWTRSETGRRPAPYIGSVAIAGLSIKDISINVLRKSIASVSGLAFNKVLAVTFGVRPPWQRYC